MGSDNATQAWTLIESVEPHAVIVAINIAHALVVELYVQKEVAVIH